MKKIVPKHPLAIRWFHWINFPVLAIMIWSGLIIYWAVDNNYTTENGVVKPNPAPADGYYQIKIGNWTPVRFFPPAFYTPRIQRGNPDYDALTPEQKAQQDTLKQDDSNYVPRRIPIYDLSAKLAIGMAWHFLFAWFFAINGILY